MTEFGYAGEILAVDLSDGNVAKLPTADYADKFLGGQGIAAKLYWDTVPSQAGAFDPENCLIYANGPVTGFPGFAGYRWKIIGKSPAGGSETFSHANLGERWGAWLKYAGYDALVVQGKSDDPVYLFINDGSVEVRDASHLWGKSTFDTMDNLKAELGKGVSVLTVGPAAENLVSFTTVLADEGTSGSGGFGAVMGSKKLKAIVAAGNKRPIAADPQRLRQLVERIKATRRRSVMPSPWATPGLTRNHVCYGCGIGCSRQIYNGENGRHFKSLCQSSMFYARTATQHFSDINKIRLLATRLCDGYGFDTTVIHSMIGWLDACYKEGLINEKETGLPLSKIGSAEYIEELTRKIAYREGFGDTLARGTIEAAESVGTRSKELLSHYVATVSSETKDYDPRMIMTTALLYATEPRRPIQQLHEVGMPLMIWLAWAKGDKTAPFSSEAFREVAARIWGSTIAADFSTYEGKALAAKKLQDRTYAKESLVLCDLRWTMALTVPFRVEANETVTESQIYSAITGNEIGQVGLYKIGERIFNLQRAILLRQGWGGRKGDRLLDYFHKEPLRDGELFLNPSALVPGRNGEILSQIGNIVDIEAFDKMKSEYYELRGWDADSGLPTRRKLEELQLNEVAADLGKRGLLR